MKVVVVTSNPKKKGALATLTEEAARGARDAGAEVEEIRLVDADIGYCRFCMKCYEDPEAETGPCVQKDDMGPILEKLKNCDGMVMVSPVSCGHASAPFKTFIERCTYTAGRPAKTLWLYGIPRSRWTDKKRRAVTIVSAGNMPWYLKRLCNVATKQMKELASVALNAEVVGEQYAPSLLSHGYKEAYGKKAYGLGRLLVEGESRV